MINRVKIYGAGSIGNHLAQASRRMGWSVDICDIDLKALERTEKDIYPSRYGSWDKEIGLYHSKEIPETGYDLVVIGTPPDSHITLARSAVQEGAKIVLVEKPLCTPDLSGAQELFDEARKANCMVFIGYDHAVSKSATHMAKLLAKDQVGIIQTLDVEFREHWGGIFAAHHWLNGPSDSYLGFLEKGGGSCSEHSHAINLWQMIAKSANSGRIVEVSASMDYVRGDELNYDRLCSMNVKTETGLIGRIVQDVITKPTRKWARVQGINGFVEWFCGNKPNTDSVILGLNNETDEVKEISKTRPDDFYEEMLHITKVSKDFSLYENSPIALERGLETMLVISAAHLSAQNDCNVLIDYKKGYTNEALSLSR